MSKTTRGKKFPGDFNSHGDLAQERVHRERVAKVVKDGVWHYRENSITGYRFVGDEGTHRWTQHGALCRRQEDIADSNEEVAGFVQHD